MYPISLSVSHYTGKDHFYEMDQLLKVLKFKFHQFDNNGLMSLHCNTNTKALQHLFSVIVANVFITFFYILVLGIFGMNFNPTIVSVSIKPVTYVILY